MTPPKATLAVGLIPFSLLRKLFMAAPTPERVSPPWLLVIGLAIGVGLVAMMVWESTAHYFKSAPGEESHSKLIVTVTTANWKQEVVDSPVPVLVDFWAPWCGPCVALSPTIERIADRYEGRVKVAKLNIDDAGAIAQKYGINAIPVVLIFKGGENPVTGFQGPKSEATYAAALDKILARK